MVKRSQFLLLLGATLFTNLIQARAEEETTPIRQGVYLEGATTTNGDAVGVGIEGSYVNRLEDSELSFQSFKLGIEHIKNKNFSVPVALGEDETTDVVFDAEYERLFNLNESLMPEDSMLYGSLRGAMSLRKELSKHIADNGVVDLSENSRDSARLEAGVEAGVAVVSEDQRHIFTLGLCIDGILQKQGEEEGDFEFIPVVSARVRSIWIAEDDKSNMYCEVKVGESVDSEVEGKKISAGFGGSSGPFDLSVGYERDDFDLNEENGRMFLRLGASFGR